MLFDADQQGYLYVKRFMLEATKRKQNYIGDNPKSKLLFMTDEPLPRFKVNFGGSDAIREPIDIDAEEFVGVKGFKASA